MGHALDNTLQDILIAGAPARLRSIVVAGTDHAAIATEARIVSNA